MWDVPGSERCWSIAPGSNQRSIRLDQNGASLYGIDKEHLASPRRCCLVRPSAQYHFPLPMPSQTMLERLRWLCPAFLGKNTSENSGDPLPTAPDGLWNPIINTQRQPTHELRKILELIINRELRPWRNLGRTMDSQVGNAPVPCSRALAVIRQFENLANCIPVVFIPGIISILCAIFDTIYRVHNFAVESNLIESHRRLHIYPGLPMDFKSAWRLPGSLLENIVLKMRCHPSWVKHYRDTQVPKRHFLMNCTEYDEETYFHASHISLGMVVQCVLFNNNFQSTKPRNLLCLAR
ncbi:hypothetical protein BD410DRAFT_792846 [Rickenella mellea]|uniref:Uncharacterized protein n=1 Tax=Rickenella mellea TaxID=50990 RepID=A0A4Y7PTW9_9AGAM|nr:hypothetical protein BD410DRAFT_792846 [Rickenella mellea]